MRFGNLTAILILALGITSCLQAQQTLLEQDFNACGLPQGWDVHIQGNQNAIWYIGNSVLNNDDNGQSMNGSCFLFIDDDANGDNTPAYTLDVISPEFNGLGYQNINFSVDVHYRDYGPANEYFAIILKEGGVERELKRFGNGSSTGDTISEIQTLHFDLSFYIKHPDARLIFRYDDGGDFGWWAGIDNVKVVGLGAGTNLIAESFDDCVKPQGWTTDVVTGKADWSFGINQNPKAGIGNSMNGSCFAYFDDDILGDTSAYSVARLNSPWFDGTFFGRYFVDFDFIFRYYSEIVTLYVQNEDGSEYQIAQTTTANIGGPLFNTSNHLSFEISQFRAKKMRIIFQFDDGKNWGWWAGLDNFKIVGIGAANDLCSNATVLQTGADCLSGNNSTAVFDGPAAPCSGRTVAGLWYRWTADFSGTALLSCQSNFNDVVHIFRGACTNLQDVACNNHDEHGFQGEKTFFPVETGVDYWIRVSGLLDGFGVPKGDLCIKIEKNANLPQGPTNDRCDTATPLMVDGPCIPGVNFDADTFAPIPGKNRLARSDVWYRFTAPALSPTPATPLVLKANADFSNIITLYSGACGQLSEVASNHHGDLLELPDLKPGLEYWVQIAGNFAGIEGHLCPQIGSENKIVPPNDQCISAIPIALGVQCQAASNQNALFSGNIPACVPEIESDVWFKFTAQSGAVRINTGADFEHVLAVWEGNCDTLTNIFCKKNPLRCDGFVTVGNLNSGKTYYVQIGSLSGPNGVHQGNICIQIMDGASTPSFEKMNVLVEEHCNTLNTAVLSVQILGGRAPFTVLGAQNGDVLNSGDAYIVVVEDALGCQQSALGVVDNCANSGCTLAASVTEQQPACYGTLSGNIQTHVAGGTQPYSYHWSNGASGSSLDGVGAGIYAVTITDALGCEQMLGDTLIEPLPLVIAQGETVPPYTGESNGSVQIEIAGGTGPYQTQWWRNGLVFSDFEDLQNAPEGVYVLRIQDAKGCSDSLQVVLEEVLATDAPIAGVFAEVYPNPAHNKSTLTLALPQAANVQLQILDAQGKQLHAWTAEKILDQSIPLPVVGLPSGAYKIDIKTEVYHIQKSLIIIH